MSVEKQARKALRRAVFWRIVGELLYFPQAVLAAIQSFTGVLLSWCKTVEMAIFYFELDAARRYKLLTGMDLGVGSGAPARYGLAMHPDLADESQRSLVRDHFQLESEDE